MHSEQTDESMVPKAGLPTSQGRIVVVTGATGFVGRHVVERLLEEDGVRLRCLVRSSSDTEFLTALGPRVSLCVGDVTRPESLSRIFDGAWGVVHLAGHRDFWSRRRSDYYALNEEGAVNVFRAARRAGVEKAVQVSTPLAFGVPDDRPFDEESTAGRHPSDYGRSKYRGDCGAWRLYEDEGLPLTIVYLAAVIGAGDPKPTMEVRRAVEGRLPALVGADTTYTYVHVRDAAEAIVRALLYPGSVGRRYLIGTERATTREYFELIGELADVPVPSLDLPESLLIPVAKALERVSTWTGRRPVLPVDILETTAAGSLLFDGSRAIEELGMKYTSLRQALAESIEEISKSDSSNSRPSHSRPRKGETS
jgi:nucleoside-diphosphate-sugar epimerase